MAAEPQALATVEKGTKGRVLHAISTLSVKTWGCQSLLPCSAPLFQALLGVAGEGAGCPYSRSLQGIRTHWLIAGTFSVPQRHR